MSDDDFVVGRCPPGRGLGQDIFVSDLSPEARALLEKAIAFDEEAGKSKLAPDRQYEAARADVIRAALAFGAMARLGVA
jgi:hypothetical protein